MAPERMGYGGSDLNGYGSSVQQGRCLNTSEELVPTYLSSLRTFNLHTPHLPKLQIEVDGCL